jgi:hypothetical protein
LFSKPLMELRQQPQHPTPAPRNRALSRLPVEPRPRRHRMKGDTNLELGRNPQKERAAKEGRKKGPQKESRRALRL